MLYFQTSPLVNEKKNIRGFHFAMMDETMQAYAKADTIVRDSRPKNRTYMHMYFAD